MKSLSKILATLIVTISFNTLADVEDVIQKTFDVDADVKFSLENINGGVTIESWSQNSIEVIATIKAKTQDDRDKVKIEFKSSSSKVEVETKHKESSMWGGDDNVNASVTYQVKVPASAELTDVELVNGSLAITGVQGGVEAATVNGQMMIEDVAGDIELDSVNGKIKLTVSDLANTQKIDVDTVNGVIQIYVPEPFNADVDIETLNGSIKNQFGLVEEEGLVVGNSVSGRVGSGDVSVEIETVNGSVKLYKR
ncbi:DUF4097 family beta strand repeat-containing protein [Thalassotalea agarivorans]|uniref:Uncharacterized protein n=1 Tax=Thalassotalea agarivorans TaxID=349064 RepID=A0A1I0HI71_THASX|nr:DUF4097 family beta strand repeat-containing protein [Thalassotalea agarivorans]SET83508.1 hypothetical protein SAMN05660429_02821 [Thalassotalea agarivorans]